MNFILETSRLFLILLLVLLLLRLFLFLLLVSQALLDGSLECFGIGADDLADPFVILVQQECWHGANAEVLGHVGNLVDVELVEPGCGVRV